VTPVGESRPTSRRSFAHAVKWSYVLDGGRQFSTLLITFVLAGIVGPGAYGTIAMATVFIMFVQTIVGQGMTPAIIQRRDLQASHLDTAFWMVASTSGLLFLATVSSAGWWADVNRLKELDDVIIALSPVVLMKGLVVVQEARLRRDMRFRELALRTNVAVLAGGLVGIGGAIAGWGVWALVAQQLTTALLEVAILWAISGWRPGFRFSSQAARDLLSFSASGSLTSLAVFANARVDALLIGLFFGPIAVGLYRLASRAVDAVVDLTVKALQAVALPELSRLQDEPAHFSQRCLGIVKLSSLLSLPALGALFAAADSVMAVVGKEWGPAAPVLRLLCLAGAARALLLLIGPMLQALGRPHLLAVLAWLSAALSAAAFLVAGWLVDDSPQADQVLGMGISKAALWMGVFLTMYLTILCRICRIPGVKLVTTLSPGIVATAAGAGAGVFTSSLGSPGLLMGLVSGSTAAVVTACILLYLDRQFLGEARKLLRQITSGGIRPARARRELTESA
jgi:O-antigen/teichoic acid export membrane protein